MSFATTYTLSQLREFEANTAKLVKQFPLNATRVKAIQKSYSDTGVFFGSFSVAQDATTKDLYLIGGRHRLQAFTLLDDPELSYPAFVQELDGEAELIKAIEIDNGSRSMTPSEKDYMSYTYTVSNEGEFVVDNVSSLRLAYLEYEISGKGTATTETVKKVWGGVVRQFNKKQKQVLVSNHEALDAVMVKFQNEFVSICSKLTTPARQYQTVVTKIFPLLATVVDGFEVVKKASTRLSKKDKEDVAICGKALEAALETDRNIETGTLPLPSDIQQASRVIRVGSSGTRDLQVEAEIAKEKARFERLAQQGDRRPEEVSDDLDLF